MRRSKLIKKIEMECPICDKNHIIEIRERKNTIIIKDEEINYKEIYYFCSNSDEENNEFIPGDIMNKNLLNARNEYRKKHNLLTSDEIVQIRDIYNLSKVDLAKLLGWGEATISRYESKAIQDDAYDNVLKLIRDNPLKALDFLKQNSDKFDDDKFNLIKNSISAEIDRNGKEILSRQSLEAEYVNYLKTSENNGYVILNIDKLESVIEYFAEHINYLYKVKLAKLLWYADIISYNKNGVSITGLVYQHKPMGALPIGHNQILNLYNLNIQEEEDYNNNSSRYRFLPSSKINTDILTREEKEILNIVVKKFKNYNAKEISDYMHQEPAYINTNSNETISFELAKSINDF